MAITDISDKDYFDDSSLWGTAQFMTMEQIIDNIMLLADDDSYFKHAQRFKLSILGKQCLKRMNIDLKLSDKAMSFQLPANRIFPYPKYMTNWHRVSVYNKCKKISPLKINNHPAIEDYLQDNEFALLYDVNENVLRGNNFDAQKGHCCIEIDPCWQLESRCGCTEEDFSASWVKANDKEGYFEFSNDLVERPIIVEYRTSGIENIADCDLKVHTDLELTISNWIKWQFLLGKRNVPRADADYYRQLYKIEKERSRSLLSSKISIEEIINIVAFRYQN
jgi:hypothetical protein